VDNLRTCRTPVTESSLIESCFLIVFVFSFTSCLLLLSETPYSYALYLDTLWSWRCTYVTVLALYLRCCGIVDSRCGIVEIKPLSPWH